jgi:hypothetical protein
MVQDSAASSVLFFFLKTNVFKTGFPQLHFSNEKWFRLVPFRSPLLRESLLLSFPPATEMFQFTGLPLPFL